METLTEIIRKAVMERYELMGRNKMRTARSLGVSLRTIRHWLLHNEWPYVIARRKK